MENITDVPDIGYTHALARPFRGARGGGVATTIAPKKTGADQRLGNMAIKEQQDFSSLLWRLQSYLWRISDNPRFQGCHRWRSAGSHAQIVWSGKNLAHWGGLQTSSSVWCSPLSAAAIARVRQVEVEQAVKSWTESQKGRSVAFLTLTLRHSAQNSLTELWDALSYCWRGITGTASWRGGVRMDGDKKTYGIRHFVKSVEITHGKNGFHPHLHVLLFIERPLDKRQLRTLKDRLFSRWSAAAERKGLKAPTPERGLVIEQSTGEVESMKRLSAYVAKGNLSSLGKEMTGSLLKSGRGDNRTLFQVLKDWGEKGSPVDRAIWREYEKASEGRRQISWSKGAKDELGVIALDDEAAEEQAQLTENSQIVALIDAKNWKKIANDVVIRKDIIDYVGRAETPKFAQKRARRRLAQYGVKIVDSPVIDLPSFTGERQKTAAAYRENVCRDLRRSTTKNAPTLVDTGVRRLF